MHNTEMNFLVDRIALYTFPYTLLSRTMCIAGMMKTVGGCRNRNITAVISKNKSSPLTAGSNVWDVTAPALFPLCLRLTMSIRRGRIK
jgi:hypothetical protein